MGAASHIANNAVTGVTPGEATLPGMSAQLFHAERRDSLLATLPPSSTLICIGAPSVALQSFRQDGSLYYLTGVEDYDVIAILRNSPGRARYTLLLPNVPADKSAIVWGEWLDQERARENFGADAVTEQRNFSRCITRAVDGSEHVFVVAAGSHKWKTIDNPANPELEERLRGVIMRHSPRLEIEDGLPFIEELRVVKTPYEIALLTRAAEITVASHIRAMNHCHERLLSRSERPLYAGELQAVVEGEMAAARATSGYRPIVGAGERGCFVQDFSNTAELRPGELVLLDAGARFNYYTADVTRTWPVSGRFSPEQRLIHDVVLQGMEACESILRPGATLGDLEEKIGEVLTIGQRELGILKGSLRSLIASEARLTFSPHIVSHFIGLDVHDPDGAQPDKIYSRPLEPGMLLTIEPGMYMHPEVVKAHKVDPRWAGIGVRIEDSYLITPDGCQNLTRALPRTADEIERFFTQP